MRIDEQGAVDYAVVGIGVNVALKAEDFPEELQAVATSLNAYLGKNYTCAQVLDSILKEFAALYKEWLADGAGVVLTKWRKLNCTLDKPVLVKDNDQVIFSGIATAVDEYGAIIVCNEKGETQSFNFGEISIR